MSLGSAGSRAWLALGALLALGTTLVAVLPRRGGAVQAAAPARMAATPARTPDEVVTAPAPPPERRRPTREEARWAANPASRHPGAAPAVLPPVAELLADLAHDDERWNATRAHNALGKLGREVVPELTSLLQTGDRQQRQLAAILLYDLVDAPTPDLLRTAVEGLEDDRLPYDPGWPDGVGESRETWICNARAACVFLDRHAEEARPWLVTAMGSADVQQRFQAAKLLALGARSELAHLGAAGPVVVSTLSAHLRDNHISGDGVVAAGALGSLGRSAIPLLEAELGRADTQASAFLSYLIAHAEARHDRTDEEAGYALMLEHGLDDYVSMLYCVACSFGPRGTPSGLGGVPGQPPAPPR